MVLNDGLFFFSHLRYQNGLLFPSISTRYGLTINDGTQRWFIFLFPSTPSKWFTFSIYTTKTNDFQILTIFSPLHAIPKRGGVMEPDPEEESNPGFRSQD